VVPPDSNIWGRSIAARDEILHGHTAQFVDEVGEHAQIGKAFDVGPRVEVQRLRNPQPEPGTGVLAEVPGHRGGQIRLGVFDGNRPGNVQQRQIAHVTDPVASRTGPTTVRGAAPGIRALNVASRSGKLFLAKLFSVTIQRTASSAK